MPKAAARKKLRTPIPLPFRIEVQLNRSLSAGRGEAYDKIVVYFSPGKRPQVDLIGPFGALKVGGVVQTVACEIVPTKWDVPR